MIVLPESITALEKSSIILSLDSLSTISIAGYIVHLTLVVGCVKYSQECQETALMLAARKGSLEMVKKLIQHGANGSLTNKVNPKIML